MGTQVQPDYMPKKINQHVPLMAYDAAVIHGAPLKVSLGTPAILDTDGILDGASATDSAKSYGPAGADADFATTYDDTDGLSGAYGRNVTAVGSSGSDHVITVTGRDYLGQPMQENLTLSGTTAITGQKAFKWVDLVEVAVGEASDTFDLGWGDRLGLPYKASRFIAAWEDAVETGLDPGYDESQQASALNIASAGVATFTAPFDGWYVGAKGIYTTGMTSAASVLDLVVDGTGVSAGDVTAPVGAIGVQFGNILAVSAWVAVKAGDVVTLTSDASGTGGVADINGIFARRKPAQFQPPVVTATVQTITTDDPRGLYTPVTATDGSIEYVVEFEVDRENMHGNAHFHA